MLDATRFDRTDPATGKLDPEGTCFVAEAAELGLRTPPSTFYLKNCPLLGMGRCFSLTDVDRSGGDVAGWRYEEDAGPNKCNTSYKEPSNPKPCAPFTVLIIND